MCSTRFSWLSLVLCPSVIWAYLRQVIETLFLGSPISGVLQRCYYFSFHEWATLFCFSDCFIIFYKNYFWYCNMVTLEITFSLLPREYYYCLLRAVVIHLFSDFLNYLARTVCSVTQLWLSLCHLKDCSPLGSSVHGIFQARKLEWVAISFSRGSSWPRDRTVSPTLAGTFFTAEPWGKPNLAVRGSQIWFRGKCRVLSHWGMR